MFPVGRFSTYATYWIRQRISDFVHNNARLIRLPSHVIGGLGVIRAAKRKLESELGREPTIDELATESKISREKLLLYSTPSFPALHLDLCNFLTLCPSSFRPVCRS